jgi:D-amino peptidase
VVFVAGDKAVCDQAKQLFGEVETVAVKEGIGGAALCLRPEVAREKIKAGVESALRNIGRYKAYKLASPYKLVLTLKDEKMVYNGQFYPGAKRTGDWELTYENNDLMEVIKAFEGMLKQ